MISSAFFTFVSVTQGSLSGESTPSFSWNKWYESINAVNLHNFYGNRAAWLEAFNRGDSYARQVVEFGYNLEIESAHCPKIQEILLWINQKLDAIVTSGEISESDVLRPGKAMKCNNKVVYLRVGDPLAESDNCEPYNLLDPQMFVEMLALGFFPVGDDTVEQTNQSLAEHDFAHLAAFVAEPLFMKEIRRGFKEIDQLVKSNTELSHRIKHALDHFDSYFSLRLYYLIEVSVFVSTKNRDIVNSLFSEIKTDEDAMNYLLKLLDEDPTGALLYKYLDKIYTVFPSVAESLGGESRDINNRDRKFTRELSVENTGSVYSSKMISKFNGSSIWSLFLFGKNHLRYIRINQTEKFQASLIEHAKFINCLRYINNLSYAEWVDASIQPIPNLSTKVAKNIIETFPKDNLFRIVYTSPDFDTEPVE
jgi:hypothetical protein